MIIKLGYPNIFMINTIIKLIALITVYAGINDSIALAAYKQTQNSTKQIEHSNKTFQVNPSCRYQPCE